MTKKIEIPLGRGRAVPVAADRILCNDVVLPGEPNPNKIQLWIGMTPYGPMGAAWAEDVAGALDELVDHDLAEAILVDKATLAQMNKEEQKELARLGNTGEPCDLTDVAVEPARFDPARDWLLLCKFAEARGTEHDDLDF